MTRHSAISNLRKGAATVELALCLPLILLLVFGSIEVTDAIFLKQALKTAAYEGARTATGSHVTAQQAQDAAVAILKARGVTGGTVSVSPAITAATPSGTLVTVTVQASLSTANSLTTTNFSGFLGQTYTSSVTMVHR